MISKNFCTGCGACYSICPFDAITMQPDIGGFLYPKIDNEKCRECGLCHKVCDEANNMLYNNPLKIIGLKHNSEEIRARSTSGGAFYLLASEIINRDGTVYGAAFDKAWRVHHVRCTSLEELRILQKSKYVQSDLEESYIMVNDDLKQGKTVLFTGTACQNSGLLAYLQAKHTNTDLLYTCDLICHGTPSPAIWKDYISDKSKKGTIEAVDFRNKEKSWRDFRMAITVDGKTKTYRQNEDNYLVLFFHNYILRDSCYNCKYTSLNRISDFTMCDFWGIEDYNNEFSDDKGVSGLMINSEKAQVFIEPLLCSTSYIDTNKKAISKAQPNLSRPTKRNPQYTKFWEDYSKNGYKYVTKHYADDTFFGILKRRYLFKLLHYTGIFDLLLKVKNRNNH